MSCHPLRCTNKESEHRFLQLKEKAFYIFETSGKMCVGRTMKAYVWVVSGDIVIGNKAIFALEK